MDISFPVRRVGKVFLLEPADEVINFHIIFRIEDLIGRDRVAVRRIFAGRKVKIAVAEPAYGLIVLRLPRSIEETGVFFGDLKLPSKINLHGRFEEEKQVIYAPLGAENGVIVLVETAVFTKIDGDHQKTPFTEVSKRLRRHAGCLEKPQAAAAIGVRRKDSTEPEEKSNIPEEKGWKKETHSLMIE